MEAEKRARAPNGSPELRRYSSAAKSPTITHRVRGGLYEKLKLSAEKREVSLSEEIERRLEASFRSAADPYIGAAFTIAEANCDVIQQLLGKNIAEDPYTRAACAKAAGAAIELVGGLAGQDTPETRALLQTEAEAFGQLVAMFVQTVRDGIKNDFTETLGQVAEIVAARRKAEVEQQASDRMAAARLLREGAPADPAVRPATPDEVAGMVDARGQLPPSIGDQAIFDDAVSGLPLVKAEKAEEAKRRAKAPLDVDAGSPEAIEPAPAPKRRGRAKAEAASE